MTERETSATSSGGPTAVSTEVDSLDDQPGITLSQSCDGYQLSRHRVQYAG